MTDNVSAQKRSAIMAAVKSEGNRSTELEMTNLLRHSHIKGWRRKQLLFGKPDFTFRHEKVLIFIDGCFWHGCPKHLRLPQNNRDFWEKKIQRNKDRDKHVNRELRKMGWTVIRVWEHELKKPEKVVAKIKKHLEQSLLN